MQYLKKKDKIFISSTNHYNNFLDVKIFSASLRNGKREFDPRITHSPLPMIEFLVTTLGNGNRNRETNRYRTCIFLIKIRKTTVLRFCRTSYSIIIKKRKKIETKAKIKKRTKETTFIYYNERARKKERGRLMIISMEMEC